MAGEISKKLEEIIELLEEESQSAMRGITEAANDVKKSLQKIDLKQGLWQSNR